MKLEVYLPIATVSEANDHRGWRGRHSRRKEQRTTTAMILRAAVHSRLPKAQPAPKRVTLTRVSPRALDPTDNLPGALKAIRDGIADALGVEDNQRGGIVWTYEQERGKPREHGVRAVLDWDPSGCPRCGYEAVATA